MMPRLSITLSFLTVLLLLSCGRSTEEGPLPGDGTVQVCPAVERVKALREASRNECRRSVVEAIDD